MWVATSVASSLTAPRRTLGVRSPPCASTREGFEGAGGTMAFGLLLVVIGLLFLVDSLNLIEGVGFAELWPVLLIAIGAAIIYDRVRRLWRRR